MKTISLIKRSQDIDTLSTELLSLIKQINWDSQVIEEIRKLRTCYAQSCSWNFNFLTVHNKSLKGYKNHKTNKKLSLLTFTGTLPNKDTAASNGQRVELSEES